MPKRKEPRPDPAQRIIDAALTVAARQGWRRTSLADIAREAGLSLLEVYGQFHSKAAILDAFRRHIDEAVVSGVEMDAEAGERPRDRLFDTLMRRFDALRPHKDAVRALAREAIADPVAALCGAPSVLRSMAWMLEAAGVPADGLRGAARAQILAAVYASVLRIWLTDESPDMMRTMAALDRRLRTVERWLGLEGRAADREAPPQSGHAAPQHGS
jgi:AcrR family transcriptional regulator